MSAPLRERASVLLAAALLFWFRLRLRLPWDLGGGRCLRSSRREAPAARRWPGLADGSTAQLARLFAQAHAAWTTRGAACLPRSLALARFLRLHGLDARTRLGFARRDGRLAGHAWVEHHCSVVGDEPAFVATFSRLRTVGAGGERG